MHRTALRHLKKVDHVLAKVIARVGPCRFVVPWEGLSPFESIVRSIVYQQISGKAGSTILGRLQALTGHIPTPEELLAMSDEVLRGVGLSRQKRGYLRDLAEKAASGAVPFARLGELSDGEVIAELTKVKGVGVWTAHMFLIFRLGRPDVLPALDLGIQTAVMKAYRLRKRPTPQRVAEIGARWRPHATIACWYLWRSLDAAE